MGVACEKVLLILMLLLLYIPGITQRLKSAMEKSKLMSQSSDCAACVPLKRRETPDAFQAVMAELLHVEQRLVLPAAEHAEGLRVEVLQQRQLQAAAQSERSVYHMSDCRTPSLGSDSRT